MLSRFILAAAMVTAATTAAPLAAQQLPDRSLALSAGPMGFDASGTGTAAVFGLSAAQTLPWRWVAIEGSLAYAGLDEQFMSRPTRLGIAELQAQLQWPARVVRPYLGFGGGVVHYLTDVGVQRSTEASVAFGAGLRAALTNEWGLRLDGRLRGWDHNTSTEATLGLMRRF